MKSLSLAVAAGLVVGALVVPGAASAQIVELGASSKSPIITPSCPANVPADQCLIVLTRTTALQTVTGGVINPTRVKQPGWIVAFTIGLSNLSSNPSTELGFLKGLDLKYHGTPQVALSVLKPGKHHKYTVVAQSGTYHLIPFLGQVLQQPMSLPPTFATFTALPVSPGEVIGLTVPTWAPVLSYNLSATKYAYRQSRRANCTHAAASQTARTTIGASANYLCNYTGTRVEYSATEVVDQPYPKTYVGGPTTPPKKPTKHKHHRG